MILALRQATRPITAATTRAAAKPACDTAHGMASRDVPIIVFQRAALDGGSHSINERREANSALHGDEATVLVPVILVPIPWLSLRFSSLVLSGESLVL